MESPVIDWRKPLMFYPPKPSDKHIEITHLYTYTDFVVVEIRTKRDVENDIPGLKIHYDFGGFQTTGTQFRQIVNNIEAYSLFELEELKNFERLHHIDGDEIYNFGVV